MTSTTTGTGHLVIEGPDGTAETIPLDERDELTLGRLSTADVCLPDDELRVSRRHARLHRDASQQWWVTDLGSRNGTWLNGERIDEGQSLRHGDVIDIGPYRLQMGFGAAEAVGAKEVGDGRSTTVAIDLHGELTATARGRAEGAAALEGQELRTLQALIAELAGVRSVDEARSRACRLLVERLGVGVAALLSVPLRLGGRGNRWKQLVERW